jgi:hypothetical protein
MIGCGMPREGASIMPAPWGGSPGLRTARPHVSPAGLLRRTGPSVCGTWGNVRSQQRPSQTHARIATRPRRRGCFQGGRSRQPPGSSSPARFGNVGGVGDFSVLLTRACFLFFKGSGRLSDGCRAERKITDIIDFNSRTSRDAVEATRRDSSCIHCRRWRTSDRDWLKYPCGKSSFVTGDESRPRNAGDLGRPPSFSPTTHY